jgi:hypothetical protein
MGITQVASVILSAPESIVNNELREFDEATFPVGSVSHQGDLILVRITTLPSSYTKADSRQLAIGTTQGARHVLLPGPDVMVCDSANVVMAIAKVCRGVQLSEDLIGPVISSKGLAEIDHPEHGNQRFVGKMTIACVYQRNLDSEERAVRTLD